MILLPKIISFKDQEILPFNIKEIFNIIIDIEQYPKFIPWFHDIKIISRNASHIIADSTIKFKLITSGYRSNITFQAPSDDMNTGYIYTTSSEGTFTYLKSKWQFFHKSDNKTLVIFDIECQFRSKFMHYSISVVYKKAQKKIISAFKSRIYSQLSK